MRVRRAMVLVVLVGAVVAGLVVDRHRPSSTAGVFGTVALPLMPTASTGDALTASWFCPGAPAGDSGGPSGFVSILNPSDSPTRATLTVVPTEGEPVTKELALPERSRQEVRLADVVVAHYAAALVETVSSTVLVEQTSEAALDPAAAGVASSTSACATAPAPSWYLADGSTTTDANETLLVFNPFPDDAVVDFTFFDGTANRKPRSFQGIPVPPHSLRALPLDDVLQRKEQIAVTATARAGRFVLGRHQTFSAKPRRALVAGLASPAATTRWWFAGAEQSAAASTSLVVFNPNTELANVTVAAFPAVPVADAGLAPLEVTVGAGQAVVVALTDVVQDANGRFSLLVTSDAPVVVERRLAIVSDPRRTTPLQFGVPVLATRWWFPSGGPPGGATTIVVSNPGATDVVLSVRSLGPAGLTPVVGSDQVTLPGAASIRIDLVAAKIGSAPVVIDGTAPVVAEQLVVPGPDTPGASTSPGIPVVG